MSLSSASSFLNRLNVFNIFSVKWFCSLMGLTLTWMNVFREAELNLAEASSSSILPLFPLSSCALRRHCTLGSYNWWYWSALLTLHASLKKEQLAHLPVLLLPLRFVLCWKSATTLRLENLHCQKRKIMFSLSMSSATLHKHPTVTRTNLGPVACERSRFFPVNNDFSHSTFDEQQNALQTFL